MKDKPDINDTAKDEGADAARKRSDNAKPYGGRKLKQPEPLPESSCYGDAPVKPAPALIKDVLPRTGVAMFGGQSGAGKTFHAIHLGGCLIPELEQKFYIDKYPIKRKGGVLYIVLEGRAAFPMRVEAAFNQLRPRDLLLPPKLPFIWNSYRPYLFEKGPDNLIRLAQRDAARLRADFAVDLVAVFIDTMGLAAAYENEDKAAQIQKVMAGLDKLSDETGALVIGVDHYGKEQGSGLRGTSAKRDCVETILTLLIDRTPDGTAINHRMQLYKIRDGEEGRVIPYKLETLLWGMNEDGEPVTTCRVVWEPGRTTVMPSKKGRRPVEPDVFMNALTMAMAENGRPIQANGSGTITVVERDTVMFKFKGLSSGSIDAVRSRWKRSLKAAIELRIVVEQVIDRRVYLGLSGTTDGTPF
jgi:AAA domain